MLLEAESKKVKKVMLKWAQENQSVSKFKIKLIKN